MAKQRKSIFETATSKGEIENAALNVQKETLQPVKERVKPDSRKEGSKKDKPPMHLYVDSEHHKQAKINSTIREMKLGEYIEWLIEQDKKNLNR